MLNRKLTVEEDFKVISDELMEIFNSNHLTKVGKKTLFQQRSGKLKPGDFVTLCGFYNKQSGTKSLAQLCSTLAACTGVSLTSQGLNERFNEFGVNLLREIFQELLSKHFISDILPNFYDLDFYRIRILDSTAFELPCTYLGKFFGYHKSGIRIQLEYELLKGEFLHLECQNGRDSDAVYGPSLINSVRANDLIIRDLGYLLLKELYQIDQRDAYYISRLKTNLVTYIRTGYEEYTKLNLIKIMEEMEIGEVREIRDVFVSRQKIHVPRLILNKLTDEQTEQRLKRKDKEEKRKGVKHSHHTKKLTRLNMFISNIPYQCIPKEEIQSFYSLRWQIEILFKAWKSIFEIDEVKKMKVERFECHLYGTLISLLITSTFAFKIRELLYLKKKKQLSEYKAISIIREFLSSLHQAILEGLGSILLKIEDMFDQIKKNGIKVHRLKKKTPFDILRVVYEQSQKIAA